MLTILVLLVGLTLATAVIAYWSDNLGKKLGKKRVSLWGMRPRTTATFLTIASSWLIMIFTLGVMLTLFKPLRQALLRYDEVKAQESSLKVSKTNLEVQVGGLNEQLATLNDQTALLKTQVNTASDNLKTVSEKLKQSSDAATRARKEQKAAERDAATARASADKSLAREQAAEKREQIASKNLQTVTRQRDATQQQRLVAQNELKAAQTELNNANADVKTAAASVKAAEARVKKAQNKARDAEQQFKKVQADLGKVRTDLSDARQNEKTANANARLAEVSAKSAEENARNARAAANKAGRAVLDADEQVAKAQAKVAVLTAQSEQLQRDNEELNNINARLSDDNQKFRDTAFILSRSDVRVPVDSTLVEHSFARSTPALDVRGELRAMFRRSANQIVPALLPDAELEFADLPSRDGKSLLTPDEIYDNLVNFISDNPNALSVRLVAARNHLAGEGVLESKFLVLPIRLALPDNFELARVELDGRSSEGPLFSALLGLVDEGTAVAKSKGVTPPLSPDVPNFYVPGSREQIFDTLREIKAINGPASVRIVTTRAISTADQLSVKFEVEPVSSVTTRATARLAPSK